METFQFIQTSLFRNECKYYRKKKERNSYTCSVNDNPWIKITTITIIIASSLVFSREAFGSIKNKLFFVQEFSADREFHELTRQGGKLGVL